MEARNWDCYEVEKDSLRWDFSLESISFNLAEKMDIKYGPWPRWSIEHKERKVSWLDRQ